MRCRETNFVKSEKGIRFVQLLTIIIPASTPNMKFGEKNIPAKTLKMRFGVNKLGTTIPGSPVLGSRSAAASCGVSHLSSCHPGGKAEEKLIGKAGNGEATHALGAQLEAKGWVQSW